jgi:hypothetical protein
MPPGGGFEFYPRWGAGGTLPPSGVVVLVPVRVLPRSPPLYEAFWTRFKAPTSC